jgi:hypothetical protein
MDVDRTAPLVPLPDARPLAVGVEPLDEAVRDRVQRRRGGPARDPPAQQIDQSGAERDRVVLAVLRDAGG